MIDNPTATSPFYYRIYNPYLCVEYNAENALGGGGADYNHVHTITRISNSLLCSVYLFAYREARKLQTFSTDRWESGQC